MVVGILHIYKILKIYQKIKSFAHGEFNKDNLANIENIAEKIKKGEDIFDRGFKIKKIEIDDTYPEFIKK